ncbi:hypothetical protein CWC33_04475 [Idiomarina sp. X4]|nr:hypothetical protein CWC33_04475 [Idiomarina sp. X4]
MRYLQVIIALAFFVVSSTQAAKIAIVIDDIGNHKSHLDAALLPGKLSFAVLPYTPYARSFALRAHHQKKQILLHMPMEAVDNIWSGPGEITSVMSAQQIKLQLTDALESIPYVEGMNNHMGSKLTQLPIPMHAVMETLSSRQLFFLDSRTTEFSVAEDTAKSLGVKSSRRHVFLDNETDDAYLTQQFTTLLKHARKHGSAIGIGHPYPETLAFLKEHLPELEEQGIELVFASELTAASSRSMSPLPVTSAK